MRSIRLALLGPIILAALLPVATPEVAQLLWEKDPRSDPGVFPIFRLRFGIAGFLDGDGQRLEFPGDARGYRGDFYDGMAVAAEVPLTGAGLEGYITTAGEWAISPRFREAEHFSEGLAAVRTDRIWGYVNRSGELVIPPQFDRARPFDDGRAAVEIQGKWGYIDKTGDFVVQPQLVYVGDFHEGRAWVIKEAGPCWRGCPSFR